MNSSRFLALARLFFRDRWNLYAYGASMTLCLLSAFTMFRYLPREDALSLHYNVYFGIDFLGSWQTAILLPVVGIVLTAINAAVGLFVWHRDAPTSYFLAVGTVVITVLITTASALIIYVNV
ncbi:MAG: hypothetical protein WC817_04100 [Patescibacteria group bacterium]|jgi:hypothetical protein